MPQPSLGLLGEPRYLQVTQSLPPALVANALAVQEAYREYQERALAREGLRRMYIGTLTLSLFLAVFGAVLLAIILGNQLARPLLLLAAGVREVARGRPVAQAGAAGQGRTRRPHALVRRDDAAARRRARRRRTRAWSRSSAARANLQTILDNLTAGVIVLDARGPHPDRQPRRHAHPARAAGGATRARRSTRCRAWRASAARCSSASTSS